MSRSVVHLWHWLSEALEEERQEKASPFVCPKLV